MFKPTEVDSFNISAIYARELWDRAACLPAPQNRNLISCHLRGLTVHANVQFSSLAPTLLGINGNSDISRVILHLPLTSQLKPRFFEESLPALDEQPSYQFPATPYL
jgi:hypothetical protein